MKRLILTATALLLVMLVASSTAQINPDAECVSAQRWHLQQAMKANMAVEQGFHLGAADAAKQLSTMGGQPCSGWKEWAMGRGTFAAEP